MKLFTDAGGKGDERGHFETQDAGENESPDAVEIIEAAAKGNMEDLIKYACHPSLFCCDYDSRTAMHLACSNGHIEVLK